MCCVVTHILSHYCLNATNVRSYTLLASSHKQVAECRGVEGGEEEDGEEERASSSWRVRASLDLRGSRGHAGRGARQRGEREVRHEGVGGSGWRWGIAGSHAGNGGSHGTLRDANKLSGCITLQQSRWSEAELPSPFFPPSSLTCRGRGTSW